MALKSAPPPKLACRSASGDSSRLYQQILQHLADKTPDAEFRRVGSAGEGEIKMNFAVSVFQQRNRKPYRQRGSLAAFYRLSESKLVDEHLVLRGQLFLFHLIFQCQRKLALVNRIAEICPGIRGERREFYFAENYLHIEEEIACQRIDSA